ncbi:MAG: AIR synthase-related protein, partial [Solirubrobacterales bacterium]
LPENAIEPVAGAMALVRELVRDGATRAAHDISDGGLGCALAEMAIAGGVGLDADLDALVELRGCSGETALFGEGPGGFVLAGARDALETLARSGVDLLIVGRAGGERLAISAAEAELDVALADAERAWRSLGERLNAAPTP